MANILKVTTPLTDYGNTSKSNPITSNDPNISNVTDLNKVTRYDSKPGESDYQDTHFLLYQNSNYESFLKILKKMPTTTELMTNLMFVQMKNMISSGLNENFAEDISQFLSMINLSKDELLSFVKAQAESSSKFNGVFFNLLRGAITESNSNELSIKILDLLRKFNDYTSNTHVLNNILIDIANITKNVPSKYAASLIELADHLNMEAGAGDVQQNAELLKKDIIPYLAKYIKSTNDFGVVRDLISSLTLNTARYENGSEKGFIDAFEALMGYNIIKKKFEGTDTAQIVRYLLEQDVAKGQNNELSDKLINILERGIKGDAGYENIDTFKEILASMLINESVYMPLVHIMLPMNVENSLMYSEIWIDPDDEKNQGSKGSAEERRSKILVKFDIKDVGYFDMIILNQKNKVDMQIFCPEKIIMVDKTIKVGLKEILERNGLAVSSISVEKCNSPISISEVFPKIYERKNTVNVRI